MRNLIFNNGYKLSCDILDTINELRLTSAKIDDLLMADKGSTIMGNILYCLAIRWYDDDYDYDEDHIHPDARFTRQQPLNMTLSDWNLARSLHNKLPNIQLLRSDYNESKGDQDFNTYFVFLNKDDKARMKEQGIIPTPSNGMDEMKYYDIENFLNFYEDRKKLLHEKLRIILSGEE